MLLRGHHNADMSATLLLSPRRSALPTASQRRRLDRTTLGARLDAMQHGRAASQRLFAAAPTCGGEGVGVLGVGQALIDYNVVVDESDLQALGVACGGRRCVWRGGGRCCCAPREAASRAVCVAPNARRAARRARYSRAARDMYTAPALV